LQNGSGSSAITSALAALSKMRVVDLGVKLEEGIPNFPTHPPLIISKARLRARDGYFCQAILISEHTGTHVDAPTHIHPEMVGSSIDQIAVDRLIAPAILYDFYDADMRPGELLTRQMIEDYEKHWDVAVSPGEIALINFGWMQRYWRNDDQSPWFVKHSPGIAEDAVILLKERQVRAVGVDTVAAEVSMVDGKSGQSSGHGIHWLPNKILIIEMLDNLHLLSRRSLFVALPLKIHQGSGSPLRPVAYCED
jgi:kynurenine formamidase